MLPVYADGKRGIYFCFGTNALLDSERLFGPKFRGTVINPRLYESIDEKSHFCNPDLSLLNDFALFHFGYPSLLPKLQGASLAELFHEVTEEEEEEEKTNIKISTLLLFILIWFTFFIILFLFQKPF